MSTKDYMHDRMKTTEGSIKLINSELNIYFDRVKRLETKIDEEKQKRIFNNNNFKYSLMFLLILNIVNIVMTLILYWGGK